MISNENFIELVEAINNKKRTGRLRVGTHSGIDRKLLFATLYFYKGQLYNCEYRGKSGNLAVADLIDSSIVSVVFIQGDLSTYARNPSVPDVGALLTMVRQRVMDEAPPPFDPIVLIEAATDTLRELYGKRADKLVEDAVERNPPAKFPKLFVDECVKLASDFVGAARAREMLKPLYLLF